MDYMKSTGGDAGSSSPETRASTASVRRTFLATSLIGLMVSLLFLGTPDSDRELPWPGMVRDVVLDREAVDAALSDAPHPATHARTPGGLIVLMPLRLLPINDLTMFMAIINSLSLGLVAAAGAALMRMGWLPIVIVSFTLAASAGFIQGLFHGSTFLPFGAALLWGWVWLERDRPLIAGALIAIAGVGRLWPFILVFPLWRRRQRVAVIAAAAVASVATFAGLGLSGLTLVESVDSIRTGGAVWMTAEHNGSAVSWLEHLGTIGIALATVAVLAVWLLGLQRSPDLRVDVLWTIPLAVFLSPLAWLPYVLVLFPVAILSLGRPLSNIALLGVTLIQLVGYRSMSDQWVTTLTIALTLFAVWHTHLSFKSPAGHSGKTDGIGLQPARRFLI